MKRDYKKVYELWWKYLQLSEDYKEFCSFIACYQADSNVSIPTKFPRPGVPKSELFAFTSEDLTSFINDDLKLEIDKATRYGHLLHTYSTFGDVHNTSFSDWWESIGARLARGRGKSFMEKPLSSFEDHFEWITYIFENHRNKGREPSYYDFKNYLLECLKDKKPFQHFVCINLLNPIGEIKKETTHFIVAQKKNIPKQSVSSKTKKFLSFKNQFHTPNFRFDRFKELERFYSVLEVFKKDGKKGKDAFYTINPNGNYYNDIERAAFYEDKKKAKRILKNVEKGFFPGPYDPKKR